MTEDEWLTGDNPVPMGDFAIESPRASDRVCRLYVAAFWNWQSGRLGDAARTDLERRAQITAEWAETGKLIPGKRPSDAENIVFFNSSARRALHNTVRAPDARWQAGWEDAVRIQPPLLREMFGNPFRPTVLDPSWLTSDVLLLARGIYAERAFDRMPILADALQDAECTDEDVLTHCRDAAQVHVRGCWVLDLLLGKN